MLRAASLGGLLVFSLQLDLPDSSFPLFFLFAFSVSPPFRLRARGFLFRLVFLRLSVSILSLQWAPCFNCPIIRRMPLNLRNRSIGLRSRQGRGTDNSLPRSTLKEQKRSRGYLMSFLPFRCALFGLSFGTSIFLADGREVGQEEMQTKEKKFGNCRLLTEPCV